MCELGGDCSWTHFTLLVLLHVAATQVDDHLAELFLSEEPIEAPELQAAIRRATLANKFVPVFMGSAYKNKGEQGVRVNLDPQPGTVNTLPTHPG